MVVDTLAGMDFPAAHALGWTAVDPLGLRGLNLRKEPIRLDEIPTWFSLMREKLEERWEAVNSLPAAVLAKRLEILFLRKPSDREIRDRMEDEEQEHRWRIRLLDPDTDEGKYYGACVGMAFENWFFTPDMTTFPRVQELLLFLLDLHEMPLPYSTPTLKEWGVVQDRWVKSKIDGKIFSLPMEGVVIPRRFGKDRARRLVTGFLSGRSEGYWRESQDHLQDLIATSMQPYGRLKKKGLLPEAIGEHSERLVRTILDPMLELTKGVSVHERVLTLRELQHAERLRRAWYPQVRRYLSFRKRHHGIGDTPRDFAARIRAAMETVPEPHPMSIVLQMIIDHLGLPVGVDRLGRQLGPYRRRQRQTGSSRASSETTGERS